jgi:hypothetical protein
MVGAMVGVKRPEESPTTPSIRVQASVTVTALEMPARDDEEEGASQSRGRPLSSKEERGG